MRIRRNDGFQLTALAVFTGILLGLSMLSLTALISAFPYYAYVSKPVYILLSVLFLLLLLSYILLAGKQLRKKKYIAYLFPGVLSILFSCVPSLLFAFGYPHVQQALYIFLMKLSGFLVKPHRFSMSVPEGHYLLSLGAMLPGVILGIVLLVLSSRKKRRNDAEYHQPKKKNYYYI